MQDNYNYKTPQKTKDSALKGIQRDNNKTNVLHLKYDGGETVGEEMEQLWLERGWTEAFIANANSLK
eukprot:5717184-Ditylum_brightwellii.AAC.1